MVSTLSTELDPHDSRILAELQAAARLTMVELGQRVHPSQATGRDPVIDVSHLDAVVTKFCLLAETATSIILNPAREQLAMLPPQRADVKPPFKKVTNA